MTQMNQSFPEDPGELSRIATALSDPTRVRLLSLLSQRVWSIDELAAESGMSAADLLEQLQYLSLAGLTSQPEDGKWSVSGDGLDRLITRLTNLREHVVRMNNALN